MNLRRFKLSAWFALCAFWLNVFAPFAAAGGFAVRITVSPASATVSTNATQQLTATVSGTNNRRVFWSVNGVEGGNAGVGTVSTAGLYTAPATTPANPVVTVTATSLANRAISASSVITIQNLPPPVSVSVAPSSVTLQLGAARQFTATVAGSANQAVVWKVNGVAGGSAAVGTISATGLYTAPNAIPSGAITVSATSVVDNAASGAANVVLTNPPPPVSGGAVRFLDQTTFGATPALKSRVGQIGFEAFLNEQFALPESTCPDALTATTQQTVDRFWINMFKGEDQLRQRTIYALSQIWVASFNKNSEPEMMIPWLRILSKNAFGNYRDLMREMTLDASMGHYLDLVNSTKPTATGGANENYARELMQLFTIGLYQMNLDGSYRLNAAGRPVPVYTQTDVRQLALALTGWTYPTAPGQTPRTVNGAYYPGEMEPRQVNHDTTAKTILGQNLPAGQTIQQDLDGALDIIFNHENVAPFVATRLVRALVTSNPSPAYIQRVALVFENNGAGVRGDLKAVIRAVLLDAEARNDDPPPEFGRLRTPVQHTIAVFRALGANFNEPLSFAYIYRDMGEGILNAPSVFGHFSPAYRLPQGNGLFGPEFQIYTPTESINRANFIYQMMYENRVSVAEFTNLAGDATALINAVDQRFLDGKMSPAMRDSINNALQTATDNKTRAVTAIYLVATSGDFVIQR
ncbi:MAG TPA: DUF1800 family protein [Pyrinomonadaceae bacterium]|jgi:uncharacterized protein (DUF1800 family)